MSKLVMGHNGDDGGEWQQPRCAQTISLHAFWPDRATGCGVGMQWAQVLEVERRCGLHGLHHVSSAGVNDVTKIIQTLLQLHLLRVYAHFFQSIILGAFGMEHSHP